MYRQNYPDDPGMHNTYTRVSYRHNKTFCERVRDSLIGILVGTVLICVASGLLFWNEGRAVRTARSLDEGLRKVIELPSTDVVFDNNNHKLVHLTAPLKTTTLEDTLYGVRVDAVTLRRKVEMYQWVEEEHKTEINEGERTRTEITYSYHTAWRSDIVRSSSFATPTNHHNPQSFAVESMTYHAPKTSAAAFVLSANLVSRINNFIPLVVSKPVDNVQIYDGKYYHGDNPQSAKVGDLRVTLEFAGAHGDIVSVIAKQDGAQLSGYDTDAGDVLEILYMGSYSAEKMFGNEHAQNTMLTWGVRTGGWLLMFIAFGCLTSIITTVVDWIPIVREVVSLGVGLMCASLSISLTLTVIALGWIVYRPWLGISLLLGALAPFILTKIYAGTSGRRSSSRED